MTPVAIQDLKKGKTFLKSPDSTKVFVKGEYCRTNEDYKCTFVDNKTDFVYIKKNHIVFTS
jgi:hypothetical protein